MRRLAGTVITAVLLLFTPLLFLRATTPIQTLGTVPDADKAVVFGAIVRGGRIAPLHAERLNAAVEVWRAGAARTIVVSNAHRAAAAMQAYLRSRGVPASAIEVDGHAPSTPDSCVNQTGARPGSLILISQRYHLPRIALQCARRGVLGEPLAADRPRAASENAVRWRIRLRRNTREAVLIWLDLLGLYDLLSG